MILTALGVPKNIVFEDYLLSNRYRRDLTFQLGSGVNEAVMTELTNAKPEYLQAAFTAIDEQWGSFDDYLEQKLGVTRVGRQKLQARLLAES